MPKPRVVSARQMDLLLEMLEQNSDIANSHTVGGPVVQQRFRRFWQQVERRLNRNAGADGTTKTFVEWRKYWQEIKYRSKRRAYEAQCAKGNGGTPGTKALNYLEMKVLEIIGVLVRPKVTTTEDTSADSNMPLDSKGSEKDNLVTIQKLEKDDVESEEGDKDNNNTFFINQKDGVIGINENEDTKVVLIVERQPSGGQDDNIQWNTAGSSIEAPRFPSEPTSPENPEASERKYIPPPPKKSKLETKTPSEATVKTPFVAKALLEAERLARDNERRRDRMNFELEKERAELERQRIRQRDRELELQAQWLTFMKGALGVLRKFIEKTERDEC